MRNAQPMYNAQAQNNNDDDDDVEEKTIPTTPNMKRITQQQQTTTVTPVIPLAFTYEDFWRSMRRNRILIVAASIAITLLSVIVFLMWLFRLIPSIPASFLSYGYIWYIPVFFTAILGFCISFSNNRELYLLTLLINLASLLIASFMASVIVYQVVLCVEGNGDANCQTFYFTRFLLLFITLFMAFLFIMLIYLFAVVIVRFGQVYMQLLNQRRRQIITN